MMALYDMLNNRLKELTLNGKARHIRGVIVTSELYKLIRRNNPPWRGKIGTSVRHSLTTFQCGFFFYVLESPGLEKRLPWGQFFILVPHKKNDYKDHFLGREDKYKDLLWQQYLDQLGPQPDGNGINEPIIMAMLQPERFDYQEALAMDPTGSISVGKYLMRHEKGKLSLMAVVVNGYHEILHLEKYFPTFEAFLEEVLKWFWPHEIKYFLAQYNIEQSSLSQKQIAQFKFPGMQFLTLPTLGVPLQRCEGEVKTLYVNVLGTNGSLGRLDLLWGMHQTYEEARASLVPPQQWWMLDSRLRQHVTRTLSVYH